MTTSSRRNFVTRFLGALGLVGASAIPEKAFAQTPEKRWQPAFHPEDAWYEDIPGIHRFVFDTITPEGLSSALGFATTYLDATKNKYSIKDSDSAIIVIVRNRSTRF